MFCLLRDFYLIIILPEPLNISEFFISTPEVFRRYLRRGGYSLTIVHLLISTVKYVSMNCLPIHDFQLLLLTNCTTQWTHQSMIPSLSNILKLDIRIQTNCTPVFFDRISRLVVTAGFLALLLGALAASLGHFDEGVCLDYHYLHHDHRGETKQCGDQAHDEVVRVVDHPDDFIFYQQQH